MDHERMSDEVTSEDVLFHRAPSTASIDSFLRHFAFHENKTMVGLQLKALKKCNREILRTVTEKENKGKSMTSDVIRIIFFMCEQFQVEDLVRYHAIEIYDKYLMAAHSELIKGAASTTNLIARKALTLDMERMYLLRIASCIQLASKSVGGIKAVSTHKIRSVLMGMGLRVDCETILNSELLVLRLCCSLNVLTPLEIVECVLMLMGMQKPEYRRIYSLSVSIIDAFYLLKSDIYSCFRRKLTAEKPLQITSYAFCEKENDYFLLAGAVIQCALIVDYPDYHIAYEKLATLGQLTSVETQEILSLAQCIACFIIRQSR